MKNDSKEFILNPTQTIIQNIQHTQVQYKYNIKSQLIYIQHNFLIGKY